MSDIHCIQAANSNTKLIDIQLESENEMKCEELKNEELQHLEIQNEVEQEEDFDCEKPFKNVVNIDDYLDSKSDFKSKEYQTEWQIKIIKNQIASTRFTQNQVF